MKPTRCRIAVLGLALACITAPCMAATAWPEKSVRLLVPWAPGGSTDVVGRIISPELTKRLKLIGYIRSGRLKPRGGRW